ncbi:MAG: response regulator transcription factor [Anaerolineales bacterium]
MGYLILIVEDEPTLRQVLAYNLRKEGYRVEVATDGWQALESAKRLQPDLILLDVMLPGLDGFDVTRRLRQEMTVPILMLTARTEEIDRVVGLEVGADDYILKPFSMRELLARIKAHLRRSALSQTEETSQVLTFDNLIISVDRREVTINGRLLHLKPKEYDLLLFFARHPRRVLSREYILNQVWGWEYTGDSRTVDVHVRWLRQKIEPDPKHPTRIVTVRGGGYRFEG